MKTLQLTLIMMAISVGVGCAKESSPTQAATPTPTPACSRDCDDVPDAPDSSGSSGSGATADLDYDYGALTRMFYQSNPNSPTNVKINIDLSRKKDSVIISYLDNGKLVQAKLGVQHPYNTNVSNSKYNGWVSHSGQPVWKGFFQDNWGAIVIVLDEQFGGQGDGQPGEILSGSVWFQNFNLDWPNNPTQGSEAMCWDITTGNHDCRSFLVSNKVDMDSTLHPTTKGKDIEVFYEKLGDFAIEAEAAGFYDE